MIHIDINICTVEINIKGGPSPKVRGNGYKQANSSHTLTHTCTETPKQEWYTIIPAKQRIDTQNKNEWIFLAFRLAKIK